MFCCDICGVFNKREEKSDVAIPYKKVRFSKKIRIIRIYKDTIDSSISMTPSDKFYNKN
jgi:hypothetical protein